MPPAANLDHPLPRPAQRYCGRERGARCRHHFTVARLAGARHPHHGDGQLDAEAGTEDSAVYVNARVRDVNNDLA